MHRFSERTYYHVKLTSIKPSLGKTWKLIKQVLNKGNKTDPPYEFRIDNKLVNDNDEIANAFNNLFTNKGPTLAKNISHPKFGSYIIFKNLK